ncbi:MAG: FAD-binding protein [Chloroflexi bacterium]|nr:FAD-binding protein [Chloroflexota bacterium]
MDCAAENELKVDVLVVGTEVAGAKAAIEAHAQGATVLAVTKGAMGRSGATVLAGAGVQAPIGHADPRDNEEVFFSDVVKGGAFLNNQKLVERLVNLAGSEVLKIEQWGAKLIKTRDGKFLQKQLPGSSYPRSLAAVGGSGGLQWRKALREEFKRQGIAPIEDFFVTKLLLSRGRAAGAVGVSLADGRIVVVRSKTTILATGGCGQLFRRTDTPSGATGDGMTLAFHAGAGLQDMEFHQFFPYHAYGPPGREHIAVGPLRYALHAKLYNSRGEEFLENYIPSNKGWGLRDPTSRAIFMENEAGRGSPSGGAYLSVAHLPHNMVRDTLKALAPYLLSKAEKLGIDLCREAFEIGPVVHYTLGGIRIDEGCETGVPGLMAVGESTGGIDGAERIDGGTAICWGLTTGHVAGKAAAERAKELDWLPVEREEAALERNRIETLYSRREGVKGCDIKEKVKDIMWEKCGLVRDRAGLEEGLKLIRRIKEDDVPRMSVPGQSRCFNVGLVDALEAENLVTLAELALSSALMREESRRAHYRRDFPVANNRHWLKNIVVRRVDGKYVFDAVTPVMHKMQPPDEAAPEQN